MTEIPSTSRVVAASALWLVGVVATLKLHEDYTSIWVFAPTLVGHLAFGWAIGSGVAIAVAVLPMVISLTAGVSGPFDERGEGVPAFIYDLYLAPLYAAAVAVGVGLRQSVHRFTADHLG